MFDGQFRSRRTVNLAGKSATSRSRKDILEASKRKRKDRELEQKKQKKATDLQRCARGAISRRRLVQQLEESLDASSSLDIHTRNLNVLLRLYCRSPEQLPDEKVKTWLQQYSCRLENEKSLTGALCHRIVRATLQWMQQKETSNMEVRSSACSTILKRVLTLEGGQKQNLGFEVGHSLAVETWLMIENGEQRDILFDLVMKTTPMPAGQALFGAMMLLKVDSQPSWPHLKELTNTLCKRDTESLEQKRLDCIVAKICGQYCLPMMDRILLLECDDAMYTGIALGLLSALWSMSPSILLLGNLLVRGEDPLRVLSDFESEQNEVGTALMEVDSDEDDEEWTLHRKSKSVFLSSTQSSSRESTKETLRTVPQLDRLASTEYTKWKDEYMRTLQNSSDLKQATDVARKLAEPKLWIKWSSKLFGGEDGMDIDGADEFVHLLGQLLKPITGLHVRNSAQSPFLSQLAFDPHVSERLWLHACKRTQTLQDSTYLLNVSIFCDIFSHRLIPMLDEQFLEQHSGDNCAVRAAEVVVRLKPILYHLYWDKPVLVDDFVGMYSGVQTRSGIKCVRARLLLTGTKLWKVLHDRWCRLLRHNQFCDESAWLFPEVGFVASDTVVKGSSRETVDDMEIDDESAHDSQQQNDDLDKLAGVFSNPKMARLLTSIPQSLPFDRRVRLFHSLIANDKAAARAEDSPSASTLMHLLRGEDVDLMSGRENVKIRRDKLYADSMNTLNKLGTRLRRRVQVSFVNQHGAAEAGIDGGGVFKEFMDELIKDAFLLEKDATAMHQWFSVTPQENLAVNTSLPLNQDLLEHYEFLGRVLGKAVYESILVDPQFCLPFLNQLLGKTNSLEDLKNYDLDYYSNLTKLLRMQETDVDSLGLTFELTLGDDRIGHARTVELMTGGREISVTKQNVVQYVHLVAHQRLNLETSVQTKAFLRGFRDLIPAAWVRLFSAHELQKLISGDDRGIDVSSFKEAMQYGSGYHPSQPVINWFWEIVEGMSVERQRKLLKFMTSCSRQPLLGFSSLEPAPCIQQIRIPSRIREAEDLEVLAKQSPLPTASTCMNLLKLPNYPNKQLMSWKLHAAIDSGAGFELT